MPRININVYIKTETYAAIEQIVKEQKEFEIENNLDSVEWDIGKMLVVLAEKQLEQQLDIDL